ncbi:putative RNA-directed DNA polymerase from transposon X-element [Mycena venus]|uniref:Putative RNA-directed DNA polymerase from transposon X-element n=1 Tax=Mycena venus TaxID=2733690 RepID=A0A8H6Y9X3_9AGAR|nr:putative RNA-directed DNA polymerase from transposon X-element [Mycena venus]
MSPPKGKNDATPPAPSSALPTPSPSPTERVLIASIREIIAVARGNKKHPTVDGYAKINANLDLLDSILDVGDHVAATLTSFKADLIADLIAATSRSSTASYASTVSSAPPVALPAPKAPPAAKTNELIISLDKAANDLLALPLPEIKARVETAAAATGAEKLREVKLKGVKVLPCDRLLVAADSEKTATLLKQSAPHWVPRLAKNSQLVVPRCEIVVNGVPRTFNPSSPHAAHELYANNRSSISSPSAISEASSLLITLSDPLSANLSISQGLAVESTICYPHRYEEPPTQCYNCQGYGHTQHQCKEKSPTCARCSGSHRTNACPCSSDRTKCADRKRCPHYSPRVYNPPESDDSAIRTLRLFLSTLFPLPPNHSFIIFGDFNKHHVIWTGPNSPLRTSRSDASALIDMMAANDLDQLIKAGTPTFFSAPHNTWLTIDLVFASKGTLTDKLIKCATLPGHGSDHAAVYAKFDVTVTHREIPLRRNFREADWDEFPARLEMHLAANPLPQLPLSTREEIDAYTETFTHAFICAIEEHVPLAKPSPYAKRWWNKTLTLLRKAYNAAHRAIVKDNPDDLSWETMRAAKNKYHSAIRREKRTHWRQYITDLPRADIWKAAKYALDPTGSPASSRIPDLVAQDGSAATSPSRRQESSTESSSHLCLTSRPPPTTPLPTPLPSPTFTVDHIYRAISKISPWKAPGPSGIPNVAISAARCTVAPVLLTILKAGLRLGYFPASCDHTVPGAYCPIAEEEGLGKVVESVLAEWLSGFAEANGLLSPNQFGGRPGRCTVDALLTLTQKVKDAWRGGKVASALLMDISQAFPSVSHDHLIYRLQAKQVPDQIVGIIRSFLSNRHTTLLFDDYHSDLCAVPNGLPQGSPLSALLYLIFADEFLGAGTFGYIDDNTRLETSYTVEETTEALRKHMDDEAIPRSKRLGLEFDLPKFQLIHFVSPCRHKDHYRAIPLTIGNITIEATTSAKLLGVILDYKLSFRNHVELAQKRGTKAALALSRIASPSFGLPPLPRETALPNDRCPPNGICPPGMVQTGLLERQRTEVGDGVGCQSARESAAAGHPPHDWRSTHHSDGHTRLPLQSPPSARLVTLPPSNLIYHIVRRCRHIPRFHRSSIHHLLAAFPALRQQFETIDLQLDFASPPGVLKSNIAPTKDQATKDMERVVRRGGVCVFMDGSGYEGGAGAAAVAMKGTEVGTHRTKHLGSLVEHTVFESEVTGAILALDIVGSISRLREVDIFMDCQPAIQALTSPKPQPGQYLFALFHTLLRRLHRARSTLQVRLHWVPAHTGIAGNEAVDELAKQAALGSSTALHARITRFETPLPVSKAAAIVAGSAEFVERWKAEWASSPRRRRLALYDDTTPSMSVARMYKDLTRPQCSILTQLRTGHIGLNAHLHRIGIALSPTCAHCSALETIPHFLLACPAYRRQRLQLIVQLGTARLTVKRLLAVKSDHKTVLAYVRDTHRLPHYTL